jgi:hypothetical protein
MMRHTHKYTFKKIFYTLSMHIKIRNDENLFRKGHINVQINQRFIFVFIRFELRERERVNSNSK